MHPHLIDAGIEDTCERGECHLKSLLHGVNVQMVTEDEDYYSETKVDFLYRTLWTMVISIELS